MTRIWSEHQIAIFEDAAHGKGHSVVRARAGTGKTTVICQALYHVPKGKSILVVAFNNKIKEELCARQSANEIPPGVDIKTCHGFGFSACSRAFRSTLVKTRTSDIVRLKYPSFSDKEYRTALESAVSFAKGTLAVGKDDVVDMLYGMITANQIERVWDDDDAFAENVIDILEECKANPRAIDFDDMCWLPAALDLRVQQYDRVFVDEVQDLNKAQLQLALKACATGGRICAVGDDRQAIYKFRGADENALDNVVRALDAEVFPLSTTYRCASSIVEVARRVVPDYRAAPDAPRGEVLSVSLEHLKAKAQAGDFVISRKNAPLLGLCLGFLRAGKRAAIAGRDIGTNLRALVTKSRATTVAELTAWLGEWKRDEVARLLRREDSADAVDAVLDRAACVEALMEGSRTLDEVTGKIDTLFTARDDAGCIMCTTVHKAKGLERERAFLLVGTFRPERSVEEANLWYVAVTRAKMVLHMVKSD